MNFSKRLLSQFLLASFSFASMIGFAAAAPGGKGGEKRESNNNRGGNSAQRPAVSANRSAQPAARSSTPGQRSSAPTRSATPSRPAPSVGSSTPTQVSRPGRVEQRAPAASRSAVVVNQNPTAPVSRAPVSQAPVSRAPSVQSPVSRSPVVQAPASRPSVVTRAPVSRAPVVVSQPSVSTPPRSVAVRVPEANRDRNRSTPTPQAHDTRPGRVEVPNQQGRPNSVAVSTRSSNSTHTWSRDGQRNGGSINNNHAPRVNIGRGTYRPDTVIRQRVESNALRMRHMNDNREIRERIERSQVHFRNNYFNACETRRNVFINLAPVCVNDYYGYRRHGFHGGFFWGIRPVRDVTIYFANPLWSIVYTGHADREFARVWVGQDVVYPDFKYPRVFFPSMEFRDIVVFGSSLPHAAQVRLLTGLTVMNDQISQKVANLIGAPIYALGENDVVITHRQIIREEAIVVEGFAFYGGQRYGFKGFIDIDHPDRTFVFVPGNYSEPSAEELNLLDRMNHLILGMGGTVDRSLDIE